MSAGWAPVRGYEGRYEVSDEGAVRSQARRDARGAPVRERILKPYPSTDGYPTVKLSLDGKKRSFAVHVLVALAFIGPRPEGLDVCHNDGDRLNNNVTNLRYDTRSENMRDTVRHGTNPYANRTHCKRGHEFTETNTYVYNDGRSRECRTCSNAAKAASWRRLHRHDGRVAA